MRNFKSLETVHQTWKKHFDQISKDLRQCIEHCNMVNKGWGSVYFDDKQMHQFFFSSLGPNLIGKPSKLREVLG